MSQELTRQPTPVSAVIQEKVLLGGDLSQLTATERLSYYNAVCQSVGLNALTRPFEYLALNGKLTLYARKDCTDQLRDLPGNEISVELVDRQVIDGVYVVTARAKNLVGRTDESIGAVPVPASPTDKANAMMKAETKAKRRVTLSICGLGVLDETELETIDGAHPIPPPKPPAPETGPMVGPDRVQEDGNLRSDAYNDPLARHPGMKEVAPQTDDPAELYRAKINTAHDEKECNAAYAATPETLKQDVHSDYFAKLKELSKRKGK